MADNKLLPVTLDAATRRQLIRAKAVEGLEGVFPLKTKNYTLEMTNPRVKEQDYSSREQKQAILEGRTLNERLVADVTVRNNAGDVVDQVNGFTLVHLPYFTQRHTFILGGNEYNVSNQIRTKPGVYTRRRGNEDLEAAFNLSKGSNFRIAMDPAKGLLHMQYGSTNIPLYPVLNALGVPHQDIAKAWGSEVADINRFAYKEPDKHVAKLYEKVIYPTQQTAKSHDERVAALHDYFGKTAMDPEVTQRTLGQAFDKASPLSMLAASKKLLEVHRAAEDTDDRDSLEFKTFHQVDDVIKERIGLDARALKLKMGIKLDASKGKLRDAIPAAPFTKSLGMFLTNSKLTAVPMQINPMELVDQSAKVTSLGEGGISSDRAIPLETRALHASHLGIFDPVRTPESGHAGIDIRTALWARRDDKGNLYAPLLNVKSGEAEFLRPGAMLDKVIAFPGESLKPGQMVDAMKAGKVVSVPASAVTHQIPHGAAMYGPTTNLLPVLHGMQGNRAIMASKHQSQALSLVHREPPLVQVKSWEGDHSVEEEMARLVVPTAPIGGRVKKIDGDYIYIEPHTDKTAAHTSPFDLTDEEIYSDFLKLGADDGLIKLHYDTNFPLAAKTYLHNTLKVKEGDEVHPGQPLADSNFTKNDALALGTNLKVGYMAYRGLNTNDGIVISQSAADKLTSEHMYKTVMQLDPDVDAKREKHRAYFGVKYTKDQYNKLDEDGVVTPGTRVMPGDPLIAAVRKSEVSGDAALLGKLSKALLKPYREQAELWDHESPGEVVDVVKMPSRITVTVKTQEHMGIGDKLSGRYGNKGVIAKIVPDHQMVQDESGKPIDLLFTSAGIISRVNPAQVIEGALGKVAAHTGKPIVFDNFAQRDNVQYAKELLAKHGLKDKETVYDPVTQKSIPGVFVGNSYILKIFKTTDSNWASHGAEKYDINQQPARGGDEGAKAIGKMEFDGLVAHNARNVLREAASLKSQKNDEFWRAIQLGLPTPSPKTTFAYDKFLNLLQAGGIKVSKDGGKLTLGPMTDADIRSMSSGTIPEPNKRIRAKDLQPEIGGLFDPAITGGMNGTKWAHVDLHEPMVNPVFEEPVRRLLGLTQKQFEDLHAKHGGGYFKRELAKIDVPKKIDELKAQTKSLSGAKLDHAIKQVKYLTALDAAGLKPDKAYVLSAVPIAPPVVRPILPLPNGQIITADANDLYKDAFLANKKLGELKDILPDAELQPLRSHLYQAVGAVFGTHEPVSKKLAARGAKGFLNQITGTRPGNGFFQAKLMKRQQDVSGRATIAPDPTLSMDEIGVPEDMLWGMYSKFVIARLVQKGYGALEAQKMVDDRAYQARQELLMEAKERPVLVNRAPSLHRFNIIGAYPKLIDGKTLKLNPFAEKGLNADYDGDAMQIHAPVTAAGVADVKKMTLSNLIFTDRKANSLNVAPDMESVIGLHRATQASKDAKVKTFASHEDALRAYHAGALKLSDPISIQTK